MANGLSLEMCFCVCFFACCLVEFLIECVDSRVGRASATKHRMCDSVAVGAVMCCDT